MALTAPAFVQSYIWDLLAHPVDVGYPPSVLKHLASISLDQSDVLFVLETSSISPSAEENPDDQCFSVVGRTCDEELIEVTVCYDSDPAGVCVQHVRRL